jgi:NAD(P)-dependent dehydrogenase (short-subunit alcohol dehydrogenase family)
MKLKDKVAIVTGGANGIGYAIARRYVAEGARVTIADIDVAAGEAAARSLGNARFVAADVGDARQAENVIAETCRAFGGLDVLVNNAGIAGPTAPCEDIAPEDWERTLAVNITGQFHCAQRAIPHLRRSKNASIANLSSAAGRFGFPLRTPYAASKWAVIGFTKTLSIELGADGIRVNAICPGSVAGRRIDSVFANKAAARGVAPEVVREEALAKSSLKRLIAADDIAHALVFLASPLGANISGHALPVDGDTQALV